MMSGICLSDNFNECSLKAVIDRVNGINVLEEPLLIKAEDGRYLVHEHTSLFDLDRNRDNVVSYSQDEFQQEYGDTSLMTYDQYVDAQKILSDNRLNGLIDETTRSQFQYMEDRIEEIQRDMADAGERFEVSAPQNTPGITP